MGELKPDTIVTMHMVVRPSQGQNDKNKQGEELLHLWEANVLFRAYMSLRDFSPA